MAVNGGTQTGTKLGEWNAQSRNGGMYWDVFPNVVLKAGHTYVIADSDVSTWSNNQASNYTGFVALYGAVIYAGDAGSTTPTTNLLWHPRVLAGVKRLL